MTTNQVQTSSTLSYNNLQNDLASLKDITNNMFYYNNIVIVLLFLMSTNFLSSVLATKAIKYTNVAQKFDAIKNKFFFILLVIANIFLLCINIAIIVLYFIKVHTPLQKIKQTPLGEFANRIFILNIINIVFMILNLLIISTLSTIVFFVKSNQYNEFAKLTHIPNSIAVVLSFIHLIIYLFMKDLPEEIITEDINKPISSSESNHDSI